MKNITFTFRGDKTLVICTIIGIVAGYLFSAYVIVPRYSSSFSFCINNGDELSEEKGKGGQRHYTIYQEAMPPDGIVASYIKAIGSSETCHAAADLLNGKYKSELNEEYGAFDEDTGIYGFTAQNVSEWMTLSSEPDTLIINVAITTRDPELSSVVCRSIIESAPEILVKLFKGGAVEPFGEIEAQDKPVFPNKFYASVIGGIIGLIIGTVIVLLLQLFNNRITDEKDLAKDFGITVLGRLPDIMKVNNSGKDQ